MKSLLTLTLLSLSTLASATQCDEGNQFFRSMQYEQREIVTKFMQEKLSIPANDVLKTNFVEGKAHARVKDVLVIGPFKAIDSVVKFDECGVVDLDSKAGKGVFEVEYLNRKGQRCNTLLKVKGGNTLLTNNYDVKITHNLKDVSCDQ